MSGQESQLPKALVDMLRAQETYGALDGKADDDLLDCYLSGVKGRAAGLAAGLSGPRLAECFFGAVAREVGRRGGHDASALVSHNPEGLGRAVVLVGRLVGALWHLRDVQGFGFVTRERLLETGERLVAEALELASRFPQAASLR